MLEKVAIGCAQIDIEPGKVNTNFNKIDDCTALAKEAGINILLFPECSLADYYISPDDFLRCSDTIPGEQSAHIQTLACRHSIYIVIGLFEKSPNERLFNTAVMISPDGRIIGKYSKTHLSVHTRDNAISKETDIFSPGTEFPLIETPYGQSGMMICKDGLFLEVPGIYHSKGAQMLFWLNNRAELFDFVSRSYAKLNCQIIASCNRAEGHAEGGRSMIIDWEGNVLAEAGCEETLIKADFNLVDFAKARKEHEIQRSRNPALYGDLVT